MVEQGGFVDRAGVVVQSACNGQIHRKIFLRHAECAQIFHNGGQFVQTGVEHFVAAAIALERVQHRLIAAADGQKLQNFVRLRRRDRKILLQNRANLLRADFFQLVHRAHDVAGLFRKPEYRVKAVEDLAVVHTDAEACKPQRAERFINNRGDFRLIDDIELAVADDVDVRLIKFPEPAALSAFAAIDLADLIAPEGERQLPCVQRDIFCQRNRQVKAQRQIAVALLKAVDLFFCFAAALGQQHIGGFDCGRIQRREAVQGIRLPQRLHHALHLHLRCRQQLHEPGEGTRF